MLEGNHDSMVILSSWRGTYVVKPMTGSYVPIRTVDGFRSWGISWSDSRLYICNWIGKASVIVEYDEKFKMLDIHEPPKEFKFVAPHQILWIGGRLLIADTQYDRIVMWDGKKDWSIWRPYPERSYGDDGRGSDRHHLNGFYKHNGSIFVVSHNREKGSFIEQFDSPEGHKPKCRWTVGNQIHNVWYHNGIYVFCNSGRGSIDSLAGRPVVHTGDFPRGVAAFDDYTFVCCSSHHFKCKSREDIDGSIAIINSETLDIYSWCHMQGFGQLYELRGINASDKAHYDGAENFAFDVSRLEWRRGVTCSTATLGKSYGFSVGHQQVKPH